MCVACYVEQEATTVINRVQHTGDVFNTQVLFFVHRVSVAQLFSFYGHEHKWGGLRTEQGLTRTER